MHHVALLVQAKATEAKLVAEAVHKEHATSVVEEDLRKQVYAQILANNQLVSETHNAFGQIAAHVQGMNDSITAGSIILAAEKARAESWEKQFKHEASQHQLLYAMRVHLCS